MPAGNDWLLYPSYDDKTFLNNVLTEEMFRAMGHYAVRCKYTELYLRTSSGKLTAADYAGIYVLIERIRIATNRVDIAKLGPTDNTPPAVTGGYLFSKDRPGTNGLVITTTSGQQLNVLEPKPGRDHPGPICLSIGLPECVRGGALRGELAGPADGLCRLH